MVSIVYRASPAVSNTALNALFAATWPEHAPLDFQPRLQRSLAYVCAYSNDELIGFVNVAWDGGIHAFILDTTVHPAAQRRGIGRRLVELAIAAARERGAEWLHVDFEPHLREFYYGCGFQPSDAGVLRLK